MENMHVNLPAEMLEVYKIQVLDKIEQGFDYAEVPCELLLALLERTQAWTRLQSDEVVFEKEKRACEPSDVG